MQSCGNHRACLPAYHYQTQPFAAHSVCLHTGVDVGSNMHVCRRSKAALLETDVPKLEKLIRKGKNVTKTVIDDRMAKVCSLLSHQHRTFPGVTGPP